jgi:hypothetical protein
MFALVLLDNSVICFSNDCYGAMSAIINSDDLMAQLKDIAEWSFQLILDTLYEALDQ